MKLSTVLRLIGALALIVMLWVMGRYDITNPIYLLCMIALAYTWEKFVVKPAIKNDGANK